MSQPKNRRTGARLSYYHWHDDPPYPSVTTILNTLNKPALPRWAAKGVAEFVAENLNEITGVLAKDRGAALDMMKGAPWRERDAAASLGTLIHDVAQARTLGLPEPKVDDAHLGFVRSFDAFLDDWQPEFLTSEAELYSRQHVYAGSTDFIAKLPGLGLTLGDYKTGKPAANTGIYVETVGQLHAYAGSDFIGLPDGSEEPMPEIESLVAVVLRPGGYKVIPVERSEVVYRQFLYLRQCFEFVQNGTEHIGDPLAPPGKALATEVPA